MIRELTQLKLIPFFFSHTHRPTIKLNQFEDVVGALLHLKKFSSEKFIFNVEHLMKTPVGKRTVEDNFKFILRK